MVVDRPATGELESLAAHLRAHPALRAKADIGLVSEVLGRPSWVEGPGDDGAVIDLGRDGMDDTARVVACGEALLAGLRGRRPLRRGSRRRAHQRERSRRDGGYAARHRRHDRRERRARPGRVAGNERRRRVVRRAAGRRPPDHPFRCAGPVRLRHRASRAPSCRRPGSRSASPWSSPRASTERCARTFRSSARSTERAGRLAGDVRLLPAVAAVGRVRRGQGRQHGRPDRLAGDAVGVERPRRHRRPRGAAPAGRAWRSTRG